MVWCDRKIDMSVGALARMLDHVSYLWELSRFSGHMSCSAMALATRPGRVLIRRWLFGHLT